MSAGRKVFAARKLLYRPPSNALERVETEVPLGASEMIEGEKDQDVEYRKMLSDILRMPLDPRAGIDYELMGKRIKLLDKIKAAGVAKGL